MIFSIHTGPSASPSDIEIPHWSAKSITLSWSRPKDEELNGELTGFVVRVNTTKSVNESRLRTKREVTQVSVIYNVSKNMTSFTLDDLKPATKYSFEIAAATSEGIGPFSKPVHQTTGEDGELEYSILFNDRIISNRKH